MENLAIWVVDNAINVDNTLSISLDFGIYLEPVCTEMPYNKISFIFLREANCSHRM